MSPSKQKYKEAVNTARDHVYQGKKPSVPLHFDERQIRIYNEKYAMFKNKSDYMDELMDDMALLHGYRYDENGKLVKLGE